MMHTVVGLDTSKDKLDLAVSTEDGRVACFQVDNTPAGHRKLITRLKRTSKSVRVCMEATGVYGLDVALEFCTQPAISVMVLNPRAARRFAEAIGVRAKTDPIDAECLLQFGQRMAFKPWKPPSDAALELRALTRRMHQLTEQLIQEKNRQHAAQTTERLRILRDEIQRSIEFIEAAIIRLEQTAVEIVERHQTMLEDFNRLCTVPGIAQRSAVKLLAEFATMPDDLTAKQVTAFVGLDPKTLISGSSVRAQPKISKRGNVYLRNALYMPAHNIVRNDPFLGNFCQKLRDRGKAPMQAKVAVMRKLLLVLFAMFRDQTDFQPRSLENAV